MNKISERGINNMNPIVKLINNWSKFKTDILKAKLENENKVQEIELIKKDNDLNNLSKDHDIYMKKTYINYEKGLKKNKLLSLLVSFGVLGSLLMTIYGTGLVKDYFYLNVDFWVISFVLTFIQLLAFYLSSVVTIIKKQFNVHLSNVRLIQKTLLIVSIIFNYKFLNQFINTFELQVINDVICGVVCVSFDLIIITFLGIIHDKKYLKYTHDNDVLDENLSFIGMVWFITTNKLVSKVRHKYENQLNEYKEQFNIKSTSGENQMYLQNIKSNENNNNVKNITNHDNTNTIQNDTKDLGHEKTQDIKIKYEDRTIKKSPESQDKNLGQLKKDLGQNINIVTQDKIIENDEINLNTSLGQINEDIRHINTNTGIKVDITKSPKCTQDVLKQKSEDIRQSEDKIKLRTQDEIKEKTQDIKTGQNKNVSGQNKTEDKFKEKTQDKLKMSQDIKTGQNKNVLGLEDLIKNIDEYIVLKYKNGDLIKVGQLKKEFDIRDRLWKDKIISNLNSAKLNENKRLERVQIDNKDKFKIVK